MLVAAAVPLLWSMRRNRGLVSIVSVGVAVVFASGIFNSVIAKALEGFAGNTSAALRLTLPYEYLFPRWAEQPLFGWGPGEASRFVTETNIGGLQASTLMKLLVEYGLVGAVILAVTVLVCLRPSGAPVALIVAVFAAWAIPAEALLNSTLVMLLLFALPNWSSPRLRMPERAKRRLGLSVRV
ncbi:O-antigen ligase family protein [Microbacterium lacus]|uniref:O-antigen ligase family protein n=1 Tax=Microbacterium lacus TaxID=415217 RepID=UPI0034DCFDB1